MSKSICTRNFAEISQSTAEILLLTAEFSMGWVDPRVGLGWVGLGWIGLDWVEILFFGGLGWVMGQKHF